MNTRFSKLDQQNPAMKIQVWEKQYPSDKIFFRRYGEYGESRIIKNTMKLTQRTKKTFQMTLR